MKKTKNSRKSDGRKNGRFLRIAAALLAVSSISAGIFGLVAEMTTQAGFSGVERIPTSYHVPAVTSVSELPYGNEETGDGSGTSDEAGREADNKIDGGAGGEVNYHVSMSSLNTGEPTSIDLTMEEAAAFGIKYLEDIMGFDAEGADVYMMYNSGTITFPRAFWIGDVRFGELEQTDDDTWSFFIDAVTGELFSVGCTETLDVNVSLGYDASLETNYGVYAEAARKLAERCNLVGDPVADVTYGGQGYGSNNPTITVNVEGSNGQTAIVEFSRYNQRLLGVITDTSNEITEKAMEDLMGSEAYSEDAEEVFQAF